MQDNRLRNTEAVLSKHVRGRFYTMKGLGEMFGIDYQTVRNDMLNGKLPVINLHTWGRERRFVLIAEEDVYEWLQTWRRPDLSKKRIKKRMRTFVRGSLS